MGLVSQLTISEGFGFSAPLLMANDLSSRFRFLISTLAMSAFLLISSSLGGAMKPTFLPSILTIVCVRFFSGAHRMKFEHSNFPALGGFTLL